MAPARWAAVVINYEAGPLLTDAVRSVLAESSAGPVEVVVVDNGSHDGSIDQLLRAFPDVQVIASPGNVGYARAANLGIAATRAPVVAVLNPDTKLEQGTASAMLARLDTQPRVAACGPRVKNPDGTDYPSARVVPSLWVGFMHAVLAPFRPDNKYTARYHQRSADPSRPRVVDWLSGSAIFLRRSALDAIGGWDEDYFMYFEDVDLCWRLRRAGWEVAYEPGGVVWHVQGASTARRPYRMLVEHHRSAWRFAQRRMTGPRVVLLPFVAVLLVARAAVVCARQFWAASRARHTSD